MENKLIKFHETELIAVVDDNKNILIAIKPICDAIGLNSESAVRSIKKHPILGDWHTVRYVSVSGKGAINHVLLPIEYVSGWLFSIDANKVKPEIREKLMIYQKECYRVLFDHFFGKSKQMIDKERIRYELSERMSVIKSQISKLTKELKELNNDVSELDLEMYRQLELVPSEGVSDGK